MRLLDPVSQFAAESVPTGLAQWGLSDPRKLGFCVKTNSKVVVIDTATADRSSLVQSVSSDADVLVLDASLDGVEQIGRFLAQRSGVAALHIVSHGAPAGLFLGSTVLNADTMASHSGKLLAWAEALTEDAQVVFYGCNVAAGPRGKRFVQHLSVLLGVPVAASSTPVGNRDRGGNWDFDFVTDASLHAVKPLFAPDLLETYSGIFQDPSALFVINAGGILEGSTTFNPNSFKITNNSTGGQTIQTARIDISSAIFPDLVFDPSGGAGDSVAKGFTVDTNPGINIVSFDYLGARDGGFDILELTFTGFDPGETLEFSIDVDPTSIQGSTGPGPGKSGSVAGLEMVGAQIDVDFSDGSTLSGQTYKLNSTGSQAVVKPGLAAKPQIEVLGIAAATASVSNPAQTVRVFGPVGADVALMQVEGGLFLEASGGFDIDPFEANKALNVSEQTATIGPDGYVDIQITLTRSEADGGLNHLVAIARDAAGDAGFTSDPIVLELIGGNASPTTTGINDVSVVEGAADTVIDLTAGFADAEDGATGLTYEVVGNTNPSVFAPDGVTVVGGQLTLDYATSGTGSSDITVRATDSEGAFAETTFAVTVDDTTPPPVGSPIRIEAEDYKAGGQNVSYFDKSAGNKGGAYRSDDVDIQATGDVDGGFNIGWTQAGEWLTYDVSLPSAGTYDLVARVATPKAGPKSFDITIDGQTYPVSFTNTGGWQTYQDVVVSGVSLGAGTFEMRVDLLSDAFNLNYFELRPSGSGGNTPPTSNGLGDVSVAEGAADTVIDLTAGFADAEDGATGLTYEVVGNSNPTLFETDGVSVAGSQLTLDYTAAGTGSSDITIRATDSQGAFVETTFAVSVNAPSVDETPPAASLTAAPLTAGDALYSYFDVTYTDASGVDATTLDNSDVVVVDADDTALPAILVDVDADGDGSPRTATYAIAAPGGRWDPADNGTYSVALASDEVGDVVGNFADSDIGLGSFEVNIAASSDASLDFSSYTFVEPNGKPLQVLTDVSNGDLSGTTFVFDASASGGSNPHFHKPGGPTFLTQHNGADNGAQIDFSMARQDGEAFSLAGFSYTSGAHIPNGELANAGFTVTGTTASGGTVSQSFGSADAPGVFQPVTLTGAEWSDLTSVRFVGDRVSTPSPSGDYPLTQSLNLDNFVVGEAVEQPPATDPTRIEAEDYKSGGQNVGYFDKTTGNKGGAYRADDVDIQTTGDVDGGFNIGWTQAGEWLAYDVSIPSAGTYDLVARVATPKAGPKSFDITLDGQTYPVSFTNTGGWQTYQDVVVPGVSLGAGTFEMRVDLLSDAFNLNYFELRPAGSGGNTPPTSSGLSDVSVGEGAADTVIDLTAGFADAEDGASGLTYEVIGNSNAALFEAGGVVVAGSQLTLDYAATGTGSSDITIRATDSQGASVETSFTVTVDAPGTNTPPTTSGLDDIIVTEGATDTVVDLAADFADVEDGASGLTYEIVGNSNPALFETNGVAIAGSQLTLDYVASGAGSSDLTVRATDSQGAFVESTFAVTVNPLPAGDSFIVEAEDYQTGGQGVAYFDKSVGNRFGAYRDDDVDIESTNDLGGGFNVGGIQNDEWIQYDVTVPETGLYAIAARVATPRNSPKQIQVEIAGQVSVLDFTNTGGWQTYQTLFFPTQFGLSAGIQEMRVDFPTDNFNLNHFEIVAVADTSAPTATLILETAGDTTIGNGSRGNYSFEIDYTDNVAIDPSTVDSLDVRVTGPNGFDQFATLADTTVSTDGKTLKAAYELAPPGGTWDFADEGDYTFVLESNAVADTSENYVAAGEIGSFPVNVENEDHFLHPVIVASDWVVDYDSNGTETVALNGEDSHTHEFGAVLTDWRWTNNGTPLGQGITIDGILGLGAQDVTLEIEDDKGDTLSESVQIDVFPITAVGGTLVEYYASGGTPLSTLIDALPAVPTFVETRSQLAIAETDDAIGGSALTGNVVTVSTGDFAVTTSGTYTFQVDGGTDSRLFIDGSLVTGAIGLTAGTDYEFELRVAREASATVPIDLLASVDGAPATSLSPATLTHDRSNLAPFINDSPAQGSQFGGDLITLAGVGFFEGDAADSVTVHWGDTDLSGADLDIERGQIQFVAPSGDGTIAVAVETPNGFSNSVDYTYSPSVVPIDFTEPVSVANVFKPTQAAWGPDGRLYVGSITGQITVLTFDDTYNVTNTQVIDTLSALPNNNILGIAFNPFETGNPKIYVAHSKIFAGVDNGFSEYNGQISVLEGPDFSTAQTLIDNLPVSNHDHAVNGMEFDDNGDLLFSIGSNTNAGIVSSELGGLPESPLSAAILKATITDPGFNGNVTYVETATGQTNNNQVDGDIVDVAPGVDVEVYASGTRNTYDIVWTTQGRLYGADNDAGSSFGDASTSATTQAPLSGAGPDEINLLVEGGYYGSPNRNRGRDDDRQNVYYNTDDLGIPGVYDAPLASVPSSTNGITEYRSTAFQGQLYGNLLAQKWNGQLLNINLSEDGEAIVDEAGNPIFDDLPTLVTLAQGNDAGTGAHVASGLDVITGPGGAIVGVDFSGDSITVAVPDDISVTASDVVAYDVFPWRAPADFGGTEFTIGGSGFGDLSNTIVKFGDLSAELSYVSDTRIQGTIPVNSSPTDDLLDVLVSVDSQTSVIPDAFQYLA